MATTVNTERSKATEGDTSLKFKLSRKGLKPILEQSMNLNGNSSMNDEMSDDGRCICGKCDLEIEDFQEGYGSPSAVTCDICKTYYHQKCGGLSDELFQIVNKYGIQGTREIPWHCQVCKKYANQLVGEMVDLRRRQDVLEHEVNQIKSQLVVCMNSRSTEENGIQKEQDVQKTVREVLEQEKRQKNIVVSNLPDIDSNSTPRMIQKAVRDLFKDKLEVEPNDIDKTERIPTEKRNLVKVQLKNKQAKRTALANAKKLHDDELYSDVYLKPDLTYEQRQRDSKLRKELRQRRVDGEKNLRIVRGEIVMARPSSLER